MELEKHNTRPTRIIFPKQFPGGKAIDVKMLIKTIQVADMKHPLTTRRLFG